MSAPSPHCGRLTDHEPHSWQTNVKVHNGQRIPSQTLNCSGHMTTEGGHWDHCDFCREVVTSDNADATCNGCVVCLGCAVDNHCRECREVRRAAA